MTPARWTQVKAVLAAVLDGPAAGRVERLDALCAGDDALRREAAALLANAAPDEERDGGFLEAFAARPVRVADADFQGRLVGPYRLLKPLGQGGMGAVYLAERADGQFEKQVAIKLIKRGMDTDEILRRFRAERRILARLEHPHIARLLDAGMTGD